MKKIKIAFFDTKPYDRTYFEDILDKYNIEIKFFPARLGPDTAALAAGFDGVCVFVNDRVDSKTAEMLANEGVKSFFVDFNLRHSIYSFGGGHFQGLMKKVRANR